MTPQQREFKRYLSEIGYTSPVVPLDVERRAFDAGWDAGYRAAVKFDDKAACERPEPILTDGGGSRYSRETNLSIQGDRCQEFKSWVEPVEGGGV